jgi:nucleoside-diphosphate-sugar epimerase
MPRVQYLGCGGYYIRDGPDFDEAGDEADVGKRTADRLCARGDFERVTADAEDASGDGSGDEAADAGDDDGEAEPFDAEAWLDQDYQTRADRVRDGDVDAHLAAIADAETSQTVLDAVNDRRDELEG